MSTVTDPKLDETDIGSPDDHAHLCRKSEITRAAIEGGFVTALCGVKFMPLRNPDNFPTCEKCKQLFEQFGERNNS